MKTKPNFVLIEARNNEQSKEAIDFLNKHGYKRCYISAKNDAIITINGHVTDAQLQEKRSVQQECTFKILSENDYFSGEYNDIMFFQ